MSRTCLDQKYFNWMPRDYKSIDLDYKKQEGDWIWATEWLAAQSIKWGSC